MLTATLRYTRPVTLVAIFAALALALAALTAHADFTGKVVAVADGDTITVLRDREQVKVRLTEIVEPFPVSSVPFVIGNVGDRNQIG